MKKQTNLFILLLLLIACNKPKNNEIPEISVENSVQFKIKDLFSKYEIIPLETNEKCLIGSGIRKIIRCDDKYFICHASSSGYEVLEFDTKGDYLVKIGNMGKGPDEYNRLRDFVIDKSKHEVLLHTSNQGYFLVYSFDNKFLRKDKYPELLYFPENIRLYDSLLYCLIPDNKMNFAIYNIRSKKLIDTVMVKTEPDAFMFPFAFDIKDDVIYYANMLDTIYSKDKNKRVCEYFIDYKAILPKSLKMNIFNVPNLSYDERYKRILQLLEKGTPAITTNLLLFEDYFIIQFYHTYENNLEPEWVIFNSKSKVVTHMKDVIFDEIKWINRKILFVNDDNINCYGYIEPYKLNKNELTELNHFLANNGKSNHLPVSSESNPLIIRFHNE